MTTEIGLYYPSIEFKNDAWVKLAVLYWDKLGRIVPTGYQPDDSETVKQLSGELDFIKDFTPNPSEKANVALMFLSFLNLKGKELVRLYRVSLSSTYAQQQDIPLNVILGKTGYQDEHRRKSPSKLARIYAQAKMEPELRDVLIQLGLATPLASRGDIGLHPKLAYIYMEALAEQMAIDRKFHPVTDNIADHLAVYGYNLERLIYALLSSEEEEVPFSTPILTPSEVKQQMAIIALQSVLPQNIANVPTEKLINLRKKHRDELTAFQTYLHEFVKSLENYQDFKDMATLQAHLEVEYEKGLKQELEKIKKCLKGQGMDTVEGVMNVRVAPPALVNSEATYFSQAHLTSVNPILAGAGALAFSLLPVIRDRRRRSRAIFDSSPAAYLFYIEEGVKPTTLTSRITQSARRLFLGV